MYLILCGMDGDRLRHVLLGQLSQTALGSAKVRRLQVSGVVRCPDLASQCHGLRLSGVSAQEVTELILLSYPCCARRTHSQSTNSALHHINVSLSLHVIPLHAVRSHSLHLSSPDLFSILQLEDLFYQHKLQSEPTICWTASVTDVQSSSMTSLSFFFSLRFDGGRG